MPRTTGSFDIAFGALEARLRIAIRKEVADLLAAERKRGGAGSTNDAVSWCPLPMRKIHNYQQAGRLTAREAGGLVLPRPDRSPC
jgi:hypothetical protein